ncbi:MAG: secretin N-terminal domain-containing protein [Gemmatimonadota bacterium]
MAFNVWSLTAAALLSLSVGPSSAGDPLDGEVRAVSLVSQPGRAELKIEIHGAVQVKDFTLSDPARVVLDVTGATLPTAFSDSYDGVNRAGIVNMRVRQFNQNTVRVVLILDKSKPYQVIQEDDAIRVSFGATESFVAWSAGSVVGATVDQRIVEQAPGRTGPTREIAKADARIVEPTVEADSAEPASVVPVRALRTGLTRVAQRQEPRITVSWDGASIQEVIAGFQAISGRSIILGKGIDLKVTAEIRDKPWPEAFKAILGAYGLSAQEVEGGIIRVDAPETLAAIDSLEPRDIHVVRVNYAKASEMAATVAGVLSKRGKVVPDTATNSLIITETRNQMPAVIEFVTGLDIRPRQVSIQAKIIFVDRTNVEQLGLKYDLATRNQFYNKLVQHPNPAKDNAPFDPGVNVVDLGGNAVTAIANANEFITSAALDLTYSIALGGFSLTSFLQALERVDLSDVQSEPVISTKDNKKASILVGEEIPIRIIDANSPGGAATAPRSTVQFKEVGIKLIVTPHVTNNRQILLELETERSAVKLLAAADLGFSIDKQNTKNELLVSDGETAVIGGLTVTTVTRSRTGIPLLSSLPLIGSLFSFSSNTENRKDLIILVTPRIIDDGTQQEQ